MRRGHDYWETSGVHGDPRHSGTQVPSPPLEFIRSYMTSPRQATAGNDDEEKVGQMHKSCLVSLIPEDSGSSLSIAPPPLPVAWPGSLRPLVCDRLTLFSPSRKNKLRASIFHCDALSSYKSVAPTEVRKGFVDHPFGEQSRAILL